MVENKINEVCTELDALAMRMLDLMKQYIDLKMSMEDIVKTGSLHLAKSRYIMGNTSVSALQLPTEDSELNAQTKVLGNDDDMSDLKFKLSKMSLTPTDDVNKNGSDDSKEDGLKRRRGKQNNDTDGKEEKPEETIDDEQKTNVKKKDVMQDPLKWFGVLVPQNMRLAQSSFNKAIETAVDLANIQLEMSSVQEKYTKLLVRKKELTSESVISS